MKRSNILLALSFLVLSTACGKAQSTSETASSVPALSNFEKIYACDGAILEADKGERRNLKFSITNQAAKDYLQSKLPHGLTLENTTGSFPGLPPVMGTLWGSSENGIFHASDINQITIDNLKSDKNTIFGLLERKSNGLRLTFAKYSNVQITCGKPGPESSCGGEFGYKILKEEANWFFQCKAAK